jgi:hypothetical protein
MRINRLVSQDFNMRLGFFPRHDMKGTTVMDRCYNLMKIFDCCEKSRLAQRRETGLLF